MSPLFHWGAALVFCAPIFAQADVVLLRRLFEEGLAKRRAEYGLADARTAQAARDLGGFLTREGDLPAAYRAFLEAASVDEKVFGPDAAQTLEDVFEMASIAPTREQAALFLRSAGSPDPFIAGQSLSMLASLRRDAGDTAGAVAYLRQAVAKAEQAAGSDSLVVASLLTSLSRLLAPGEAAPHLQRAIGIYRRELGPDDAQTATAEVFLVRQLTALGDLPAAVRLGRHALEVLERSHGPQDGLTLAAARGLATALRGAGHAEEADQVLRRFSVAP